MNLPSSLRLIPAVFLIAAAPSLAGPFIPAGDLALRHDIQRLADHGVITSPVSTWPLAWGPVLEDLNNAKSSELAPALVASLERVLGRANWETRTHELTFKMRAAVADNGTRMRSFQNTPRGKVEVGAGGSWTDDWINVELNLQGVDSDQDREEFRADDSTVGVLLGNWSVAASTQQRWWGPGWDGSLILSNNARPIPSLVIDRMFTDAFKSRWLSWIGPWDLSVIFGQLESEREVPNAQFFGMRFNFRPASNLEFGISRTAQWCGDGRPCDSGTFVDLFLGNDNLGDAGVSADNEPGNQLAGFDFRWSPTVLGESVAVYGQLIGEDEAGGFPSRWIGQFGGEWSGYLFDTWSTRVFAEFAGTACQFYESSERFNCAYNHNIYETGYRYRSRSIGHGADNDARLVSVGAVVVDAADTQWHALLRYGGLNRGGPADVRNTLTPQSQDIASIDLTHSRVFAFGVLEIGAGYEMTDDVATGADSSEGRLYLQWRSSY